MSKKLARKNQTNGRKTSTVYSLLKATLPWRWTDAIMISARNIGTIATTAAWPRRVLRVRSYARQASTKRRESNGSDIQWRWAHQGTPQNAPGPQIGVLLNNRATKLAAFLLYKFGASLTVVAFEWAQFLFCAICCKNECATLVQSFGNFCRLSLNAL